jgi:hypothetical protein
VFSSIDVQDIFKDCIQCGSMGKRIGDLSLPKSTEPAIMEAVLIEQWTA